MIGYGPEDDHFVLELTYNYGIGEYRHGNDFRGIHIKSTTAFKNLAADSSYKKTVHANYIDVFDPAGYRFLVYNEDPVNSSDPVQSVEISVSDLKRSIGKILLFIA